MPVTGLDSAFGPSPAQAAAARSYKPAPWPDGTARDSPGWWAGYVGQRSDPSKGHYGAFNVWTPEDFGVIKAAGFVPLPIFVPLCWRGRILPDRNPEADARLVAWTLVSTYRVEGAAVLDTENSMSGDPWTYEYEQRYQAEMRGPIGWADITYAGAFSFPNPPSATYAWWIWPGKADPRSARQAAGPIIDGLPTDLDTIGDGFPLARWV